MSAPQPAPAAHWPTTLPTNSAATSPPCPAEKPGSTPSPPITAHPRTERHLAVHDQHLTGLNAADNTAWNAGSRQAITSTTVTGPPDRIRDRLRAYARNGITEIVYQPTCPDIPGELEHFIAIARDV